MKKKALLLFIIFSTTFLFAQNELKARIEYEAAEKAFEANNFQETISKLESAEKNIGSWTPKTSYLKILALDKFCDYDSNENSYTVFLQNEVKLYMNYYEKNKSKIIEEKFKEIYGIEEKLKWLILKKTEPEMSEYKTAIEFYNQKKYSEAISWLEKAIKKNNSYAMMIMGYFYDQGFGVTKSVDETLKWYKLSASKGNVLTMNDIGAIYASGLGVTQNDEEAIKWFSKAAEIGFPPSMCAMGAYYEEGSNSVAKDLTQAFYWYKKAAEKEFELAYFRLGWLYANGTGTERNYGEAMKWYLKCTSNNYSYNNIGSLYENGQGVNINYQKALDWYLKAANDGNSLAMKNIAELYRNGKGVPIDYKNAKVWYEKAAIAGNVYSMKKLAELLELGLGVKKDKKLAAEWKAKYDSSK